MAGVIKPEPSIERAIGLGMALTKRTNSLWRRLLLSWLNPMTPLDPWLFTCKGKQRKGDSQGMLGIHVWRKRPDNSSYCLKCGTQLNVPQTQRCFSDGQS